MSSRKDKANAIRALAMDAVQQANSGHPGMPMGMADIAEVLWSDVLRHNPTDPAWPDRDRFVVSNGHGSMLVYALLHLSGYDLPLDELRNFRQLGSKTAGHPESHLIDGVETTTGPLGQGIGNAVGMALAEQLLAAEFNRPGHPVIDHRTWVFHGDGCLMEGLSHEVCSLAGTLQLGKLNLIYDDNNISIDGEVEGWFTDDTVKRFEAYGWHVLADVDGHDPDAIARALQAATAETSRPTLIQCKTVIGYGSPNKAGKEESHGAPLGDEEIARTRAQLGWTHEAFAIPEDIYAAWDARERGMAAQQDWQERFAAYAAAYPAEAAELERRLRGDLPADFHERWGHVLAETQSAMTKVATRKASQMAIGKAAVMLPEMLGGSADLTASNLTNWPECGAVRGGQFGRHINYGVREFGMSAIMNGIALHGGYIPFGGTFLVFSDYARNAMRMSALMAQRVIYVMTHDSIGLGEDGPTHQPVEHLASLRLIPNLEVWRPADVVETHAAWQAALENAKTPTVLALSRQNLPALPRDGQQVADIFRGGYVLWERPNAQAIVIATGSEVEIALAAAKLLDDEGIPVRVVSMPCVERFAQQGRDWRDAVLPPALPVRLAVEAGVTDLWWKYVGTQGDVIGLDRFGESAPGPALYKHFGFTAEKVAARVRDLL
ncbi:MAG: transketolase [Oceanococcaceae bacterium]